MSTSYGYVCKSHDPELYSDHWVINQKGADALRTLFKMECAGKWYDTPDVMYPDQPEVTPIEIDDYRSAAPVAWLREHPRCVIALVDEYGKEWPLYSYFKPWTLAVNRNITVQDVWPPLPGSPA